MTPILAVDNLRKTYGDLVAVDGISFQVQEGEVFGMVGPNGAGKTTTIECIEGLRQPDGGTITLLGMGSWKDGYQLRQQIGTQLQEAGLPDRLKVGEIMRLFASFYQHSVDWRPLLEQFGLAEKAKAYFSNLSGGQKQRLFIALALINNPKMVFLDELTTGLDPQARRAMWDLVRDIREHGKTVFLTTHYMEEAEQLCDRVAIIDHGRMVALDTPAALIRSLGAKKSVVFTLSGGLDLQPFRGMSGVTKVERLGERVVVYGQGERLLSGVVTILEQASVPFRDLHTEQPTLEDVFLALTGREMRD